MKKLLLILLLLPTIAIADLKENTSTIGVEIASETVYVPAGYSVIITGTFSISSKFPYDRSLIALRKTNKLITEYHANREHEDGSTTGLSDVISITAFDTPVPGTYRYNAHWKVNKGVAYSGAQDFQVLLVKN